MKAYARKKSQSSSPVVPAVSAPVLASEEPPSIVPPDVSSPMYPLEFDDAVLLGYVKTTPRRTIGFHQQPADPIATQEPVLYDGPHLLTCAPTGEGKGRCSAIPTLLEYPGQVVAIDVKGELYDCTHRKRREMGQQVIKLDPFHVIGGQTDGFNPLDMFKLSSADADTDSQMMASMLAEGNKFGRDPFWDNTACGLNSGVINYLMTRLPADKQNLNEMRRLLNNDDVVTNLAIMLDRDGKNLRELAYQEIAAFLQLSERDTRPGVLATAQAYTKALNSERVSKMLEKSSFDLQQFADGKPMSIYIIIPPERLESHRALLRITLAALFAAVFSRRKMPNPRTLFLVDEAGNLGSFPMMKAAMTLARGYGVRVWSFWQDMQQLTDCYPTCWKSIVNNAGALQLFGLNTKLMARDWADVLGCSTEELLALKPNEQMLQLRGRGDLRCERLDYLVDPRYVGGFDDNRFYSR